MPMERITLRIPEGFSKLLDQLAAHAAKALRETDKLGVLRTPTRSDIAREALHRGLLQMGTKNLKRKTSDSV